MKELNEMTIRSEPTIQRTVLCHGPQGRFSVWDWIADPIWASGYKPRRKAGHMIAVDPPVKLLMYLLHPRGRPHMTQGPVPRQQCFQFVLPGVSGDDAFQHIGQPC